MVIAARVARLITFLRRKIFPAFAGPHCYEMFLGKPEFDAEMETALGTFFLTDYMVRHFERIVMKGMGLRQHPQLRDMYFAHYTRVLYIAQTESESLQEKARQAAIELGLDYEYRYTGYGDFNGFYTSWREISTVISSMVFFKGAP